jgi:erythromycin esterase-like protein
VPSVTSLEELHHAAAAFTVADAGLVIEAAALEAARRSLEASGLLLLGEVHGVRENPLIIRALMLALGLNGLALEWPAELAPAIGVFLAGGTLADHPLLWAGDGRITAGHLAVFRERAAAGPLSLTLFDGAVGAGWGWAERDEAMAERILATSAVGDGILVVAGNAHTPTTRTSLGMPLGGCLARQRPGVAEIRIRYGGGRYYNIEPRRFVGARRGSQQPRLHHSRDALVLDLPAAREAVVPQRPGPWPDSVT